MAKANARRLTYYLDSCIFLDLIEHPADQEPAKTIAAALADAEEGRCSIVTSTVTMAEVWYAKAEVDRRAH